MTEKGQIQPFGRCRRDGSEGSDHCPSLPRTATLPAALLVIPGGSGGSPRQPTNGVTICSTTWSSASAIVLSLSCAGIRAIARSGDWSAARVGKSYFMAYVSHQGLGPPSSMSRGASGWKTNSQLGGFGHHHGADRQRQPREPWPQQPPPRQAPVRTPQIPVAEQKKSRAARRERTEGTVLGFNVIRGFGWIRSRLALRPRSVSAFVTSAMVSRCARARKSLSSSVTPRARLVSTRPSTSFREGLA
jgi:hypothetical protein